MTAADAPRAPVCRVCGEAVSADREVRCARCDTPHHRDCWAYVGHCSLFACASTRTQDLKGPVVVPGSPRPPPRPRPVNGKALVAVEPQPPRAVGVIGDVEGVERDFGEALVDLELDTALESFVQWGSVALLVGGWLAGFPKRGPPVWGIICTFWPLALALMVARLGIDCRYLLDNRRRLVLYRRSIFGVSCHWKLCRFDQVREVIVVSHHHRSKHRSWYTFSVALSLPDHDPIPVSRDTEDRGQADGFCRNLARHLGCTADPSAHENPWLDVFLPATAERDDAELPAQWQNPLGALTWGWLAYLVSIALLNLWLLLRG